MRFVKESPNALTLCLEGRADVSIVSRLAESLSRELDAGVSELVVDVAGVRRVDAALLQLFLSVKRHFAARGISLRWRGVGDYFLESASAMGAVANLGLGLG